jgi:exosome complex RNA-binding protein Rrp4
VIQIPVIETEDGSGSRDVIVGVNGRAWQMQRGHDIDVPHRVVVALDNAVRTCCATTTLANEIRRHSKRFTYGVIERPSRRQEIEAWNQRTGAEFCA